MSSNLFVLQKCHIKKLKNPDTKLMLDFENPQAQYPFVIDFVTVDT